MGTSGKKLIVIVGPTASGKTAVAISLATLYSTEIISADSRQFYREMNIGTAKPTTDELKLVRHYFIDSHTITENYDAAQFAAAARELMGILFEQHDHLVVCGGSGLYIRALLEGFDDIPEIPEAVRGHVAQQYQLYGLDYLQQEMKRLDPAGLEKIDMKNPARLMRALEVVVATGKPIAYYQKGERQQLPYQVIKIGLELDREVLYERIDERMDAMIAAGLFEEAKRLYPYRQHNALQTVGYQEIFDYMDGHYDYEEAVRQLKRNSRRYAKRQITWFKRDREINWFNPANIEGMTALIDSR